MDAQDILQHLLDVESQANILVVEAQAEAERRISEKEKTFQKEYQRRYAKKQAELETEYQKQLQRSKEEYDTLIKAYIEEIQKWPVNTTAFNHFLDSFLFKE